MLLMVDKRILIVTGVLALGAAAVVLKDLGSAPKADPRVGKPLLEPTAAVGVDHVDITQGTTKLTLVRGDGDVWRIADAGGFPADAGKIVRLIDDLSRTSVQSSVATPQTGLAEFGLATPAEVALAAKDKDVVTLKLGDARKTGGQYVGIQADGKSGDTKVYLVSQSVNASADADAWELKQVLDVPKDQVKTVAFRPTGAGKKAAVLTRQAAADPLKLQDLPEGQKEAAAVASVPGNFAGITFTKRYDPTNEEARSALAGAAVTQIETFDGRTFDVLVGSVGAETKKYFFRVKATTTESATAETKAKAQALNDLMDKNAFEVPAHVAQRFERSFSDFVEAPAAPAKG